MIGLPRGVVSIVVGGFGNNAQLEGRLSPPCANPENVQPAVPAVSLGAGSLVCSTEMRPARDECFVAYDTIAARAPQG
jgi:hypothetical protein